MVAVAGASQSPANGTVQLRVIDCANAPIRNTAALTVAVKQNGVTVGTIFDVGTVTSAPGTFFVFDVPPGPTEISAGYFGTALLAHVVTVRAGETTQTFVRPGF